MNKFNSENTPKVKISQNFRPEAFQIKYSQKNLKHGNILHKFSRKNFRLNTLKTQIFNEQI